MKCGIGKFIGLPEEPNLEDFERMWKNRRPDIPIDAMTLLSGLLDTPDDAIRLQERLKLSAYERDFVYFITKWKNEVRDSNELM